MRKNGEPQTFSILALGMVQFLVLAAPVTAQIPCEYEVTTLQFPIDCGLGTVITTGLSLNENGAVVGTYRCPLWTFFQGFMWTAEAGFEALDPPEGVIEVFAADINDHGVICGTLLVSGVGNRAFVYDNGEWTILPPVVDVPGARCSANAINNAGIVAGQRSLTEELNPQNAYIWSAEKGFTDLGVMNGPNSAATDVNEFSWVCGWTGNTFFAPDARAFLWTGEKAIILEAVPGGFQSAAFALNNKSLLAGSGRVEIKGFPIGAPRAFIWEDGRFTMLGTLPDHLLSRSKDVNDEGIVVGNSSNVGGNPNIFHAFIWTEGAMNDLNDFIDPRLPLLLRSAPGIANTGQIIANGNHDAGETLSFLLIPRKSPLGDLDGDCIVGVSDLLILLGEWGQRDSPADLNGDGIVGVKDLLILLGNWG